MHIQLPMEMFFKYIRDLYTSTTQSAHTHPVLFLNFPPTTEAQMQKTIKVRGEMDE